MRLKPFIFFLVSAVLVLSGAAASAQVRLPGGTYRERPSGLSGGIAGERGGMLSVPMDSPLKGPDYQKYKDNDLKDLEQDMNERSWTDENTAWERAKTIDTEEAYRKFIVLYPNSVHHGEADKRIIDLGVDDALAHAHNSLPGIKQLEKDEESPTSTITIENNTEYPLTVLFSGFESYRIIISPGRKGVMTVENGDFKIAASVPPQHIRPFAGATEFTGGSYEIGFWVVRMP